MAKLTQKQQWFRKSLLGKIHQSERYLSFYKDNEEVYRQMLKTSFNQRSSAKLSISQLIILLDFLNEKTNTLFDGITTNQAHYIRHKWMQVSREKNISALMRFIRTNTGKNLLNIESMSKQEASGVLAMLNKMQTTQPITTTTSKAVALHVLS